jgi:hypothetical protein
MSSFSGWAVIDLADGQDADGFIAALCASQDEELWVLVEDRRVFVFADHLSAFVYTVKELLPTWGTRAITAEDWDEHGVTNRVLGPDGKVVHNASIDESDEVDNDTPEARRAAAELFGSSVAAIEDVSSTWAVNGAMPWFLGEPYLQWWAALGAPWPTDFGKRAINPRDTSADDS